MKGLHMKTPLTQEHLDLAHKVHYHTTGNKCARQGGDVSTIAHWLLERFMEEDKNFDRDNWLKACGL